MANDRQPETIGAAKRSVIMTDISQTTGPTDYQIDMAMLERGPDSDGETPCSDCGRNMAKNEPLFWARPSYEYPSEGCDAYCGACTVKSGQNMIAICSALESGEMQP